MDLKIVNITKQYGSHIVLNDISFDLNESDFITIIGKSGSGKTTLLSIVNSLLSPTSGHIYYNGKSFHKMSMVEKNQLRKKHLSIIFQQPFYIRNFSVKDNILFSGYLNQIPFYSIKREYEEYMEMFELKEKEYKKPNQLSGGEIQKMTIVRTLLENKDVIIADEPTGDLDSQTTQKIITLFNRLQKKGKTILMTTHNEMFIQSLTNIYSLDNGKIQLV